MNIPLAFGEYKGRTSAANAMVMTNMMVENDQEGGATSYYLTATPGCNPYVDLGQTGDGRGGYVYSTKCLSVVSNKIFLIDLDAETSEQINIVNGTTGAVQFCENPTQIMLIAGTKGYVYTKASETLEEITDADFPTPLSCTFKDGYGCVVKTSTGKIYVSGINDFTSWSALSFTTAEFEPDNLMGVFGGADSLFAFGTDTIQVYYNSGDSTYPFDPRPGANLQIGCGATNSIAGDHNVIFWLDNYGSVRMMNGFTPNKISTPQIDYQITQLSTFSDARGSMYTQEGHVFYCLSFPTAEVNYVYDVTTGQWHRRTSNATDSRWRPSWISQKGTLVLAGDYSNGNVYKLDRDVYTDNSATTRWFFTSQNVNSDRKKLIHHELELHIEAGVGAQGEDPQIWMQYSDDDGKTWTSEKWRSMGKVGEYSKRVKWDCLGESRSRIYRFGGTDAVKRNIISAHLEVEKLEH